MIFTIPLRQKSESFNENMQLICLKVKNKIKYIQCLGLFKEGLKSCCYSYFYDTHKAIPPSLCRNCFIYRFFQPSQCSPNAKAVEISVRKGTAFFSKEKRM